MSQNPTKTNLLDNYFFSSNDASIMPRLARLWNITLPDLLAELDLIREEVAQAKLEDLTSQTAIDSYCLCVLKVRRNYRLGELFAHRQEDR